MRKRGDIVSYTDKELAAVPSLTNWKKVDATTEAELEASIAADPDEFPGEWDWTKAFKGLPPRKKDIHIRIDSDVLDWFKQTGEGYQIRTNNVLRAFFESRQRSASAKSVRPKVKRAKKRA